MRDLFRCDYCGTLNPLDKSSIFWERSDVLDGERQLWLPAVYCSTWCGRCATSAAGSGRG